MRTAPLLAALTTGFVLAATIAVPASAATTPIDLGSATTYSVLAGGTIANTGASVIAGNVGAGSAISGMPEASVAGVVHRNDGPAIGALRDASAAYTDAASRPRDGGNIVGQLGTQTPTLAPGTYYSSQPQTITGDLTFDAQGDAGAVFIVQVDAPVTTMPGTTMRLTGGADPSRIFWQVLGDTTIGASSAAVGTILSASIINLGAGSTLTGRALAINSPLSLDRATVRAVWSTPQPGITIDGAASRASSVGSLAITGTATSEVGHTVVVTVGPTRYSSLVAASGTWAVSIGGIANGDYPVTASVTDPGGTATAQQVLSVAVPGPAVVRPPTPATVVTITGGTRVFTTDRTPKVSGTTTAGVGTSVTVKLGSKKKTTTVSASGRWSVTFAKQRYRTYSLVVKTGAVSAKQKVVIRKAIPPKITIGGGTADSTDDTTPTISGRTNARVGSRVTVTLAGKTRTGSVRAGKNWSVTFPATPVGTHTAVVKIKNSAGTNSVSQRVTIESTVEVLPVWTVDYSDQVIQGTSDAPVGTPVAVTVGILLFDAQVQAGGLWGVRLNQLPVGTYPVAISAGGATTRVTLVVASAAPSSVSFGCGALSPNGEAVVSFYGFTLTASMQRFGSWNVPPAKAADCGYLIVPSVTDETASTGTISRIPKAAHSTPDVSINGGDVYTADASIRDISGTSTAAPGSLVRMRMAGQTIETRVTPQHTWSFYRNDFAAGTHQLVISVIDATAGAGYAAQSLTIG